VLSRDRPIAVGIADACRRQDRPIDWLVIGMFVAIGLAVAAVIVVFR